MQLVFAKINKEKKECNFYIGGEIGSEVNGTYIEADIQFINQNKSCDKINFLINSEGGSVINGMRIISAIINSRIPVYTYNRGYCMSMGGFIWLAAKKENRYMSDFARLMLHNARFLDSEGNIVEPENADDKALLDAIKSQLSYLTEKATGKSEKQIEEILSKDTYYTSDEAVKAGLLLRSNVIPFDKHPQFSESDNIKSRISKIAAFYNEIENNNLNTSKMKLVAAKLKLNAEASENAIIEKIDAIVSERDEAMQDLKELQDENNKNVSAIQDAEKKIKAFEDEIATYKKEKEALNDKLALQEVEAAVKDGYFKDDEESKKNLVSIAKKDIESFRAMKGTINRTVKAPDLNAMLTDNIVADACTKYGITADQFTYDYLWANKPEVLKTIKAENPKLYNKLEANWIKLNS